MNADAPPLREHVRLRTRADRELELDFIREFSTGGESLNGLSIHARRERIRLAIYTQKLGHTRFRGGPLTYAQAYAACYGQSLEMRGEGETRSAGKGLTQPDTAEPSDE